MKKIILKCLINLPIMFLVVNIYAQDIITLKNGDEIKSKVLEITSDQVKYKKWDNMEGPSYSSMKSEIFMIKYQNGSKDVFKTEEKVNTNDVPVSNEEIKKNEAVKNLENYVRKKAQGQIFNIEGFRKTNGVMNNIFGQMVYKIDFEIDLRFSANGWLKGNSLEGYWRNNLFVYPSEPDLSASGEQYMYATKPYQSGTFLTLGCVADMNNTDNGFIIKSFSIKTEKNYGVTVNPYLSDNNLQNNKPKQMEEKLLQTDHKGFFYDKISASNYYDHPIGNSDNYISRSSRLFYRTYNKEIIGPVHFKIMELKNDKWIYKIGDTLTLKIDINDVDLISLKRSGLNKTNGKGEFILSTQIEDGDGKEYYSETNDFLFNKIDKDPYLASIIDLLIKINPEKLKLLQSSKDLFLSFLLVGKKDNKSIVEGFVKFQVE